MSETTFTAQANPSRPSLPVAAPPQSAPDVRRQGLLIRLLTPLASLRITVVLFALSLVLVFCGTLAMMNFGIKTAVDDYFRSYKVVWFPLQIFVQLGQVFFGVAEDAHLSGSFPWPGGWLLGGLLLVNLLAAHVVRFQLTWKRAGILVLHAGIVVLMLGELFTGLFAVEGSMVIFSEGSSNYLVHPDHYELAILSPASATEDDVVAVPDPLLRRGGRIQNDRLPFDVEVLQYMKNSHLVPVKPGQANPADRGIGLEQRAVEVAEVSGVDPDQDQKGNTPAVYLHFLERGTDRSLGKYLLSVDFMPEAGVDPVQQVSVGGKSYEVLLRTEREYKPYTVTLEKFHHEVYPGTEKPKDFSSYVRLVDPERGVNREARIWMNHPLSYAGETFYQISFLKGDVGTVLQVVRNPGWWMPYLGCLLVAGGMALHFGIKLTGFLSKALAARPAPVRTEGAGLQFSLWWAVPIGLAFLEIAYLIVTVVPARDPRDLMHVREAGRLPVLDGGRVKPLDTLARTDLMLISGKQEFEDEAGNTQPAIKWLLDVMCTPLTDEKTEPPGFKYKIFRIDNLEVLNLLQLERRKGFRYALGEFADKIPLVAREADRVRQLQKEKGKLDLFDKKIMELEQHLGIYVSVARLNTLMLVPPPDGNPHDWQGLLTALAKMRQGGKEDPAAMALAKVVSSYARENTREFNEGVASYQKLLNDELPAVARTTGLEATYNHFAPFYQCTIFYVVVFLLVCLSWLGLGAPFRWAAFWLLVLTFLVHTAALLARMYLQDRPPVTNLYSSAVFIGWGCVILGLVLEVLFRIGIGTAIGAVLGFGTVFISHHLALGGDTLEMMQAVLDTNFWLATHVTCVTMGYTATLMAGTLGVAYLVCRLAAHLRRRKTLDVLVEGRKVDLLRVVSQMTYGIVCFAMLFSFTGTVLGGIWADESWGRFWGWDPKENGALLIVIWNALILHARWGGLVKAFGLETLAVGGNMVTGWSWFGTNQLGVGLHAYGFNDTLAVGLRWFWIVHLAVLACALGVVVASRWRSPQAPRKAEASRNGENGAGQGP
jgi:ABC-type transport system involved in cytochrome c biogenesis permease subunit